MNAVKPFRANDCDKKAIRMWIEQGALNLSQFDTTDTNTTVSSFQTEIKPIVDANCAVSGCHVSNAQSPPLASYTEIKNKANRVKATTGATSMPKNGTLTAQQIKLIADWVDAGSPNN